MTSLPRDRLPEAPMDPTRFDDLARRLARPLHRRRLLAGVAGMFAGSALAARPAAASHCTPPWVHCDGAHSNGTKCMNPNYETCCNGNACYNPGGYCADLESGLCCLHEHTTCRRPDGVLCVAPCPEGQSFDENCICCRCAEDTTPCGNSCCAEGETCEDDVCVAACAAEAGGASRTAGARAACPTCPQPGMFVCKGQCYAPCGPDKILNYDTCECECLGAKCGGKCCPLGQECATDGGATFPARCCPKGTSCEGKCLRGDNQKCCKHPRFGEVVCGKQQTCCFGAIGGGACCNQGTQVCKKGKCVKKKKR